MCRKGLLPKNIFEFRNNIKSTWKILSEITKRINKTNNSPSSEFVKDHKMITDDKEICNSFNDYFRNVGPTLANDIKCNTDVDYKRFMEDPISNSIYLNPVTEDEFLKIVSKLKNKHSTGYDDLSINTIKKSINLISKPLTYICNKSLENKTFPKKIKIT